MRLFSIYIYERKEGNVLCNDTLNTIYSYIALDIW